MSRKPAATTGSTAAYRERERQALLDLAMQVYADKTQPEADRRAARERLMAAPAAEPDFKRLTTPEVRQLVEAMRVTRALLAKARGEAPPRTAVDYPSAPAPTLIEQLGLTRGI